ncbi:MAG TPA: hypothetical protein VFW96_13495 [Thermomicrobiales bacterium]|nr:hypothetical protein [Thermomicrobiales bacterium]
MGAAFVAVLEHHLDSPAVLALPRALDAGSAPGLAAALATLRATLAPAGPPAGDEPGWRWDYIGAAPAPADFWASHNPLILDGPAGVWLTIEPRVCAVGCGVGWALFLSDRRVRGAVRRACYELAQLLGSPRAVYLTDDEYDALLAADPTGAGYTFDRIVAWLHERHGPPVLAGEAPYLESETSGYIMDTFEDFMGHAR